MELFSIKIRCTFQLVSTGFFVFEYQEEGFHVSFRELPQYQAGGFQYRCIHKLICLTILSAPPPFPGLR